MRTLSDADIEAIKVAVVTHITHPRSGCATDCPVTSDKLVAAVEFYDNLNKWFDGTKKTVWNTILIATILLILGLVGLGFWRKNGGGM